MVLNNDNDESREMVEMCYKRCRTTVNPIIDWTYEDVWDFIKSNGIHYCELYDEGFSRLGCIGCPMAGTKGREKEFIRWSKYKDAYLNAFKKMIEKRNEVGLETKWEKPIDVFNWWMEYKVSPGQISLFDEEYEEIMQEYDD